jgi:hypothetical protein
VIPAELALVFDKNQKLAARMKALDVLTGTLRTPESLAALRWLMWQGKEDAGLRNSAAEKLREWDEEHIAGDLTAMLWDNQESPRWRTDCIQHLYESYTDTGDANVLETMLEASLAEEKTVVISALWALARVATMTEEDRLPDRAVVDRIHQTCLAALGDEKSDMLVRVAGVQSCSLMKLPETLTECRKLLLIDDPKLSYLRMVAVAAIGDLGDMNDARTLHKAAALDKAPLVKGAAQKAVVRIMNRVMPMGGQKPPDLGEEIHSMEARHTPLPAEKPAWARAGQPEIKGPRLVFDNLSHDFGRHMAGKAVLAEFYYTNEGDEILHISDIHFGCGCSIVDGKFDKTLEPGQRGTLPVSMNTGNLNGEVSKTITISSNDTEQKQILLILHGTIWQPFEIQPRWPTLGTFTEDNKELSTTVRITRKLPEPVELSNPVSDNPVFSAAVRALEEGKSFELTVKARPPYKRGSNSGVITLDTTCLDVLKLPVPVGCYLADRVAVSPTTVFVPFPHGPLSKPIKQVVGITHNVPEELDVSNVSVSGEKITAQRVRETKNNRWRIELTFEQGFVFPEKDPPKLTFNTNDPSAPKVEVPITNKPPQRAPPPPEKKQ